jgi:hypothetical protein
MAYPLQAALLAAIVFVIAVAVGWYLYTNIAQPPPLAFPYYAEAYANGTVVLCVRNAGPTDYYGEYLVYIRTGEAKRAAVYLKPGEGRCVKTQFEEAWAPGQVLELAVVGGDGRAYRLYPAVRP